MRQRQGRTKAIVALGVVTALSIGSTVFAEEETGSTSFWGKTKVTGQLNTSYNYNFNNPPLGAAPAAGNANANNLLRVFDIQSNNFDFNLAELAIENAPTDWAKFRLDLNFGSDVAVVDGLKGGVIGTDEFGVQQAYAELTAKTVGNGLTFKAGHFVTPIGYEVIESAYNLNTSRSILFGFAIPFTHTGLTISYPFNDVFTASIGIVNGWDLVADNNKGKTFLGQFAFKPIDTFSFSIQGTVGPEQGNSDGNMRGLVDVVANWTPNEMWLVGGNFDWGKEEGVGGRGSTNWAGGALYIHYKPFDYFGFTARGEYFSDDGSRTGFTALDYAEGTGTFHFYMTDGWESRLEFRHDQADKAIYAKSDGSTRKFQDTISAEVVYAF